MELSKYVGKKIRVDLSNGYYYEGVVKSADDNSITILDRNNKVVEIKESIIAFIREVAI
jgi:small nuclear ribonucleoprotein (snRNP)-like protein